MQYLCFCSPPCSSTIDCGTNPSLAFSPAHSRRRFSANRAADTLRVSLPSQYTGLKEQKEDRVPLFKLWVYVEIRTVWYGIYFTLLKNMLCTVLEGQGAIKKRQKAVLSNAKLYAIQDKRRQMLDDYKILEERNRDTSGIGKWMCRHPVELQKYKRSNPYEDYELYTVICIEMYVQN